MNVPPDLSRKTHMGRMHILVLDAIMVIVITIAVVILGSTIIAIITIIIAKGGDASVSDEKIRWPETSKGFLNKKRSSLFSRAIFFEEKRPRKQTRSSLSVS